MPPSCLTAKAAPAIVLAVSLFTVACDRDPEPLGKRLPQVKQLFEAVCSRCHSTEIPLAKVKTREGWRSTVRAMQERGATLSAEEAEDIARYLTLIRGR